METTASKQLQDLTVMEVKGLAITILREEFGYKWDYISRVMSMPPTTAKRWHKKFNSIYLCTENENSEKEVNHVDA